MLLFASQLATFGQALMILSLVSVSLAFWLALLGLRRKDMRFVQASHRASVAFSLVIILAYSTLIYAFFVHDFSISYVARYSERAMPAFYLFCAGWGGQDGSLLFWTFLMGVLSLIAVHQVRRHYPDLHPSFLATVSGVQLFFCIITFFAADPFGILATPPADGKGLNPLLQTPVMAIHPPNLYMGLITFYIPYALGMAGMVANKLDNRWLLASRRWTLISWSFLTLGNLLGAYWAYNELGWGGFWAWDPVENASFLPWLTATAFVHSSMIQERQGMMKVWNMSLLIITFFLTVFGTFLTRSGLISSIHAFARSDIGTFFVVFLALILLVSFGLMYYRREGLASRNALTSPLSREASFLLNNALFSIATFIVLLGTTYPLIREYTHGTKATVGPAFFNRAMSPVALGFLVLLGICPLLSWRKVEPQRLFNLLIKPTIIGILGSFGFYYLFSHWGAGDPDTFTRIASSGVAGLCVFVLAVLYVELHEEVSRRRRSDESFLGSAAKHISKMRRRYGGYLVHIGVVFAFLGFAGYGFRLEKAAAMGQGELASLGGGYLVRFEGMKAWKDRQKRTYEGYLSLHKSRLDSTQTISEGQALSVGAATLRIKRLTGIQEPERAFQLVVTEAGVTRVFDANQPISTKGSLLQVQDIRWSAGVGRSPLQAKVQVYKTGASLGELVPARQKFNKHPEPTTEVALMTRLTDDIYAILVTWEAEPGKPLLAHFKFYLNPLVFWLWFGGLLMLVGVVIALLPKRKLPAKA
ncbi:MAG: heme lyase CcmF/NrfE family subunit [Myxococcales bacterium]|nr:heme lyase CcmF/NrfE family subunit [Myxococcales bacterium]